MKLLPTLCCVLLIHKIDANSRLQLESTNKGNAISEPLILTPYLKEGKIKEAQKAALVQNEKFLGVTSYSGSFTVDDRFDSNLYFWFFPSASANFDSDPVLLWLTGGPGATSLYGVFETNGPFIVDENGTLSLNDESWYANHSLLYIDNPVGTGFSFTNDGGLALNETKVGEDLYSGLTQFFQLFPDLQKNDFFISGESYAGKHLPAIGYTILKKNPQADVKINLQGILIGNGWTDPIHQINYAPYLYNIGLVSEAVADEISKKTNITIQQIKEGHYLDALESWRNTITFITDNDQISFYNYIEDYDYSAPWIDFITTDEMRKTIHVGNLTFGNKGAAEALDNDRMQSVAPWVETLLENYRVLIYTGQLDIQCGYPMVLEYLNHLNFTGAEEFKKANRTTFLINWEPVGYARTGGKLTELLVRNAGHFVPRDQPEGAHEMVFRFTRNAPFI